MRPPNRGAFRDQVNVLRRQFLQDGGLPFTDVLTEQVITDALATVGRWLDRVFSPVVTLWVFLGQSLAADQSCRAAVARLIAHRVARGREPCSSRTGAYCQARKRLPERFFSAVARLVGRNLDERVDRRWLWRGRRVCLFDGTTVSMPDTPANQAAYPPPAAQRPGVGFPLARIAAAFSLACGAVVELGVCRYAGNGQSELGMLRTLWGLFRPGDVVLADRLLCSWAELVMLKLRGVDTVTRLSRRTADFRRGRRLGPGDHVVAWPKPQKPRAMDRRTYNALPDSLAIREVRVTVAQPGFRTRSLVVVTTLLDPEAVTAADLAGLYGQRRSAELDLRSLKRTLQMGTLRCKTPELVRKEVWAHVLAYNLIRAVMAQAAAAHGRDPRDVSFKGAAQTLEALQPVLAGLGGLGPAARERVYRQLRHAVAGHRVGDRPGRFEPRRRKRRPKPYDRLMKPRDQYKRAMRKGRHQI